MEPDGLTEIERLRDDLASARECSDEYAKQARNMRSLLADAEDRAVTAEKRLNKQADRVDRAESDLQGTRGRLDRTIEIAKERKLRMDRAESDSANLTRLLTIADQDKAHHDSLVRDVALLLKHGGSVPSILVLLGTHNAERDGVTDKRQGWW